MIKMIIFDIDGILTDDTVMIDECGKEQKRINYKDIDAVFELHRKGFKLAAVTGEGNSMVDYFEKRFPWNFFFSNSKRKKEAIQKIETLSGISSEEMCFVGEGKYDVEALEYVKLGICPRDAIYEAKQASDIILQNRGGDGCVWELTGLLDSLNQRKSPEYLFYQSYKVRQDFLKALASDQQLIHTVMEIAQCLLTALKAAQKVYVLGPEKHGGFFVRHIADRLHSACCSGDVNVLLYNDAEADGRHGEVRNIAEQLKSCAREGDMLIAVMTEVGAADVSHVLRTAEERGVKTALFQGNTLDAPFSGKESYSLNIPSGNAALLQETQLFLVNVLIKYLEENIFI